MFHFASNHLGATASIYFLCAVLGAAKAESGHRHHGAHEHGRGELKLAVDGNVVQIELELPGEDVVGFEHAPRTQRQKQTVARAIGTLKEPIQVIELARTANCRALKDKSKAVLQKPEGGDDDHREFIVSHSFRCYAIEKLSHIEVRLFKAFSSLKEVRVQAVSARKQIAGTAKRRTARVSLKGLVE